jgi:predicted Zn-dependent peptidase
VAGPGNPHQTLGRMLAAFSLFDDDPGSLNRVLPNVMALTAADLQSAARTYLAAANRVWIEGRPR